MKPKALSWVCPTCSVAEREACILNSAPYSGRIDDTKNQANDHLKSKRHNRAMCAVGPSLTSMENMEFFFGDCIGGAIPDWTEVTPEQALGDYIEECGGDPDKAIGDITGPPPPIARRPMVVKRTIMSSAYASTTHNNAAAYCKILCCWDDPVESTRCQRTNCPYHHFSDIAGWQPNAPGTDFFEFMPLSLIHI